MIKTKQIIFSLVLAILLIACTHALAPSDEIPATEPPADIPSTPVTVFEEQKSARITIVYRVTDVIPDDWVKGMEGKKELRKMYTFTQGDNIWSTIKTDIYLKNNGPLFDDLVYSDLSNSNGNCGINTYYSLEPLQLGYISFQPIKDVCQTIDVEEIATITFGLENCDKDSNSGLSCRKSGNIGILYYQLNSEQDRLSFQFSETWDPQYQYWISETVDILEFDPIQPNFFDFVIPGANYTIYKNNK